MCNRLSKPSMYCKGARQSTQGDGHCGTTQGGPRHGFQSSFRDLAPEETDHRQEVVKAAFAHVVRHTAEVTYVRSDLFERRRGLENNWPRSLADGSGENPEPLE